MTDKEILDRVMRNQVQPADAIRSLVPGSAFKLEKDGKTFVYFRNKAGLTQPTESEIDTEIARLQAAEPIHILRVERDKLLASSDWTGLADTALTNEQAVEWKLYRQKLRQLPEGLTTEFKVKNAKWPTKP